MNLSDQLGAYVCYIMGSVSFKRLAKVGTEARRDFNQVAAMRTVRIVFYRLYRLIRSGGDIRHSHIRKRGRERERGRRKESDRER